jgi:outer membrane protein assembly factor BamB
VPRWLTAVVAVLLVLGCAATSTVPASASLPELLSIPIGPADPYALTDDGLLVVQSLDSRTLAAYQLSDGRLRWRAPTDAASYRVRYGAGLVLLSQRSLDAPYPGTVALSAESGAVQWRLDGSVVPITDPITVLAAAEVRSLTGPGRRVQRAVTGVEPRTGQVRWSLPVPSTAVLHQLPGPTARMMLVHDSGVAELRELATGRRLAGAQFPPTDYAPGNPIVAGDVVVLRHPGPAGIELSAYDAATLALRWRRPADEAFDVQPCGRFACILGRFGVRALDPADGHQRWAGPGWRRVEQRGGLLLAYGAESAEADLVGLVDADTGRVTVPLRRWRPVSGAVGDHVLITRSDDAGQRTLVAATVPGAGRPQLVGELPAGVGDCRATWLATPAPDRAPPGRVVCRSGSGTLVVRSYRPA